MLIRLCRAAAESYADHVQLGKPPVGLYKVNAVYPWLEGAWF